MEGHTLNTWIGSLGHLLIILAFVTALVSMVSFFISSRSKKILQTDPWLVYAKYAFYLHVVFVMGTIGSLYYIIGNNLFEYHYAFSHSSRHLPAYYKLSSFWEGQEGSFLLWIFWNALLGLVILHQTDRWRAPVMTIFALVQAFLVSMILGVVIPGIELQIGSSPFKLLRDVMEAPIFAMNPDFIPEDGSGLNPLLQNYWMVIHPPTLFLGFATTLIPFSFAIAGLWQKDYTGWIRPALPWSLFSAAVLGVGILMGGYWAYETLSFGGYWNWDPVENAVYVPWLVLVASIHVMISYHHSSVALKSSLILVITTFLLILYSTFLTRSGVLGESSVHSFTDLGLNGQLLLYLITFTLGSIILLVYRWKALPVSGKEVSTYSREFWIFLGATTLCLMAFQVLFATSIPVFNQLAEAVGLELNAALPADQVIYFSNIQLWFALAIALLSGTGQFFWWQRMDRKRLLEQLTVPFILTLLVSAVIIVAGKISSVPYILLLTAAIYSLIANGKILFKVVKAKPNLSGGAVTHMGVALMLIGILFSSGYSKTVSQNNSGVRIFDDELENRENVLLWLNEAREMEPYTLRYQGKRMEIEGIPGFVDVNNFQFTGDPFKVVAVKDWGTPNGTVIRKGDTLELENPENTYYAVSYQNDQGKTFTLYPRVQENEQMGNPVVSPDIRRGVWSDLYTHVTAVALDTEEAEWSRSDTLQVSPGETFFINDFVARLEGVERVTEMEDFPLRPEDIAVKARVVVQDNEKQYTLTPHYVIRDMQAWFPEEVNRDLGIFLRLVRISPRENSFWFELKTTQKDYIVLKAIQKPFINLLWTGTLVLVVGFGLAIRRRYRDYQKKLSRK